MNWNFLRESYTHLTSWKNAQYINEQKFLLLKNYVFLTVVVCVCVCVCKKYWWFIGENKALKNMILVL